MAKLILILCSILAVAAGLQQGSWLFTNAVDSNHISATPKNAHANHTYVVEHVLHAMNNYCQCIDWDCGCCAHMEFPKISLNNTVCLNMTYLPKDYGISLTLSIGNWTVYNETVSARSPPPICIGVPYLTEYAEVCIKFYNMDAAWNYLYGCVDIEGKLSHFHVGKFDLGCFQIGKKSKMDKYLYYSLLNNTLNARK